MRISGQKAIIKLVQGCPLAVDMANKSDKEIDKAIKKDGNYPNRILDVYNNGCKQVVVTVYAA